MIRYSLFKREPIAKIFGLLRTIFEIPMKRFAIKPLRF